MRLHYSLKILALVFWWYVPVYVLSILPSFGLNFFFVPDFRGEVYAWDFELFFLSIFVVWGLFLWKSSYQPLENKTFILFTIWAMSAHILAMLIVGAFKPADLIHLSVDAVAHLVPLLLVVWGYQKEIS